MRFVSRAVSLGFLAILFYYPLAMILARGLSVDSIGYLAKSKTLELVWFTVWQALVSSLGAMVIGLIFAYVLYRKSFAGQHLLRAIFTVPFVLPVLVIAIAFSTFQISNVIVAIILSHVYINAPLVARAVGSLWLSLGREVEDAAELDGAGRLSTFFRITVHQLRQVLVASFVLTFTYCAAAFGTVLLLGNGLVNSIETKIYGLVFSYLDLPAATALALVQLALTLLLFLAANRITKTELSFGASVGSSRMALDRRDAPIALAGLILLVMFIAPIWNVFQKVIQANAFFGIEAAVMPALLNSLRNVTLVILLCCFIGLLVGYQLSHQRGVYSRLLSFSYLAPIGVSTVLVGLGYLVGFSSFRSNWLVIPLAQTVLALPLVARIVSSALSAIDPELIEQGQVDGASRWQVFRNIELPSIRPSLSAALGFAGIIALGDFGASAFLSFGDQDTLPIVLYRLFSKPGAENYAQAMSLTAWFIIATVLVVLVTSLRTSKRNEL